MIFATQLCHRGNRGNEELATIFDALTFEHPKELEDGWEEDLCTECHRYLY